MGHAVGDAPFCPGGERLMRALAQVWAMAGRVSSAVVAGQAVEQAARPCEELQVQVGIQRPLVLFLHLYPSRILQLQTSRIRHSCNCMLAESEIHRGCPNVAALLRSADKRCSEVGMARYCHTCGARPRRSFGLWPAGCLSGPSEGRSVSARCGADQYCRRACGPFWQAVT